MRTQVVDIASERIAPCLVLFETNFITLAKHISEITERNTLGNLVTLECRILHCCYFPVVTELLKNLCFGVVTHG